MFSRRSHGDVKKSTQKVLDPKKDVITRLKHLRALIDSLDKGELKNFFETHNSQIYFIFYENFITLESSLKQKGNKSQREELDSILFLFEKVLQLLPEKIFFRWHFHSIGSILKKLLHTGNSIKIRCEGIRLFLLWLQALQTNCSEEQLLIFACLVPGFPAASSAKGPCTLDTIINNSPNNIADGKILPEEIVPLVPAVPGEKIADDQTCFFLEVVLKYMVIQASGLEWRSKENEDTGFIFLFTLFKKYYLPHLFPNFTKFTNLYKPLLDIPHLRPKPLYVPITRNSETTYCTRDQYLGARVAFINWLVTFFLEKKYITTQNIKNGTEVFPKIIQTVTATGIVQEKNTESETSGPSEPDKNHSNSSTLSDRRLSNSSLCSVEEEHRAVYDMVQSILLHTRDNINFVNEVFRQAFLLPPCEASTVRKVTKVYRKWILLEKPFFMMEPETAKSVENVEKSSDQIQKTETDCPQSVEHHGHRRSSSWGRTYSFSSAISRGCMMEEENRDIKAGIQPALQVFLTNSANVFLLEPCPDVPKLVEEQVDVCKNVLYIYRRMIMEQSMNKKTWEQMLQVLLRVTDTLVRRPQDGQGKDIFAESLAGQLFRTVVVAWIRANLSVFISRELWDELLGVLSSLTDWEELINEWAYIMDSLTAVLARYVYGLDMSNLPLDKLSELKEKKQRGRGGVQDVQKGAGVGRSFSLSWRSHPEAQEPMRLRSATTSGAPGVEKARNVVRQKATEVEEQGDAASDTEGLGVEEDQQQLTRSSSTSDLVQNYSSDSFQGNKSENITSDIGTMRIQGDTSGRKENETPLILIRRSSSPADLEFSGNGSIFTAGQKVREKSESISSETSNGYLSENEAIIPWQSLEEDQDVISPSDITTDSYGPQNLMHISHLALTGSDGNVSTYFEPSSQPLITSASPPLIVLPDCKDSPPLLDDNMHHSVLHITEDLDSSECLADDTSIIAGGSLAGWHPDSAAVLWRRILGILGDVNRICCPNIHAKVFRYLYDLWHKLSKIRDNLGISTDNHSSPPRPVLIPPLRMFASWLFKATTLPSEFKEGKLQAYRLICEMMTKRQDVLPNYDFLVHFYYVMHMAFMSNDQDVLNIIIRHCSPQFFFLSLPGFTMVVGDFITAAARILSSDTLEYPRTEATTILGSIVCFSNLYRQMPSLQPITGSTDIISGNEDIKDYSISILLMSAKNEPSESARCIAICSLGIWICEELLQCTNHPCVKDAINIMGVTLKLSNKVVAHLACDIFRLLVCHWHNLQKYELSLPKKITEIFVATIAFLLPSAEHSIVEADKKLMVSLLLCLLDWCMAIPLNTLLEPITMPVLEDLSSQKAPLLDYIYRVLHCCIHGSNLYTQQSHYLLSLADLCASDYDPFLKLENVKNTEPQQSYLFGDFGNLLTVAEEKKRRNMELIPLTARMIMTHLVNHLGHHPLSGGPAILHSLISENHDNSYVDCSDLSSEVFKSPNLQLFVLNDSTLVSYLQIPAEKNQPGEPQKASSDVRVIVRDISGKYSWEGGLIYGPLDSEPFVYGNNHKTSLPSTFGFPSTLNRNTVNNDKEEDELYILLENLGNSSPECLSHPQLNLNEPTPPPFGMSIDQENKIMESILKQSCHEEEHIKRWSSDISMKVARKEKPDSQEPKAPFYFCRLLLNDLGMNSWDRRKRFHILKKNSKLLRELKNLDSRQCRETHKIAVFYIAEGQEDKCSILSNTRGSQAYEDFVSGLGWEVNLATHCGFMGGLQRNGSTGQTAPYYATSTIEVIFHVSTRMPSDSDDCLTKKLRHLGNDEVHIVWSEHSRDYRSGIIPTDFGDVLIIIYPMKNHMFYIQIMKKAQVPFFGPLFDGAIVTGTLLPSLVRATCINASRSVKSRLTLYQSFYEERALYLEAIVQNHREAMTFEDFSAQVFSPSPSCYTMSGAGSFSGSTCADLHPPVTTDSTDQVSPTMPRATKSRVSGKLRRSASAISKSSN
ncbi:ral GTPase-activating protein subunit alpha-2 isoform X2 [Erpetoichthys calabaricus]|uniref:ral GTPase-activating protein subunit alpha-2 isoform X2 n=1 Tax=Erpetoichthys calabaricus TaxID=27687 RepID=UPI002234C4F4|nr:ral GTPase-activating protein subunit alpha-2 isoform X2 [Erpetoichthys calabaricus]